MFLNTFSLNLSSRKFVFFLSSCRKTKFRKYVGMWNLYFSFLFFSRNDLKVSILMNPVRMKVVFFCFCSVHNRSCFVFRIVMVVLWITSRFSVSFFFLKNLRGIVRKVKSASGSWVVEFPRCLFRSRKRTVRQRFYAKNSWVVFSFVLWRLTTEAMGIWRFAGAFAVVERQSECGSKTAGMHVSQPMDIGVC